MPDDNSDLTMKLESLKHHYGLEYEMIRATAAFEHAAIRPLFILNGGALVVYLGLFGALRRNDSAQSNVDFSVGKFAVILWLVGLVLATLTVFIGAQSQFAFRKLRGQEILQAEIELGLQAGSASEAAQAGGKYGCQGACYRKCAVVAGVLSIILFMAAFWPAFLSIK